MGEIVSSILTDSTLCHRSSSAERPALYVGRAGSVPAGGSIHAVLVYWLGPGPPPRRDEFDSRTPLSFTPCSLGSDGKTLL